MPNTAGNPFNHAFEILGHPPDVATNSINDEALELLNQVLTIKPEERGRMVLLRSPRAGFGKTHLLTRLSHGLAQTHELVPLTASKGRGLDAAGVLDSLLRRLSRNIPEGGGLTVLDLLARRIFAKALEVMIHSGAVLDQDRENALKAIKMNPAEIFDFQNEESVTARWAMANFNQLGAGFASELATLVGAQFQPVAWWVELLFHYSSAPLDQVTRNDSLFETVFGSEGKEMDRYDQLVTLLSLTGLVVAPVLILDELEGFAANPKDALQTAVLLNALNQSCGDLAVIIAVNEDVWETTFSQHLPGGLLDRLSDITIDLAPMRKEQAMDLLVDRAGSRGKEIFQMMDLDSDLIYARGVIRMASKIWQGLEPVFSAKAPIQKSAFQTRPIDHYSESDQVKPKEAFTGDPGADSDLGHDPSGEGGVFSKSLEALEAIPEKQKMEDDASGPVRPLAKPALTQTVSSRSLDEARLRSEKLEVHQDQGNELGKTPEPKAVTRDASELFEASLPPLASGAVTPIKANTKKEEPHKVTQDDQEKVEGLLRQFRDRYGRE